MNMNTEPMLTVEELAVRFQMGVRSSYRLCSRKGFPAIRVGRLIRIPEAALSDWIQEQVASEVRGT